MALISGFTILRSLSLFHMTLAYFFLCAPLTISDQTLVFIMGEAMGMPHARAFDARSPALAFVAVLLGLFGFCDLLSLSLPEEMARAHWGIQFRLALFFVLSAYPYLTSRSATKGYKPASWDDGLKNRVFFTWAFIEMMLWFWAYVTLREERKEAAVRLARKTLHDTE